MKKIILSCLLALFAGNMLAQTVNVDSLVNVLETHQLTKMEKIDICLTLCEKYQSSNLKNFRKYAVKGLQLAEEVNKKDMIADFCRFMGISYENYGKTDSAMFYYEKGLEWAIESKNKKCEAMLYKNKSYLHRINRRYKDMNLALDYLLKALAISEEIGDKKIITSSLVGIGSYYSFLINNERAEYFIERAKTIAEEIDYDFGKIECYYNLGELCFAKTEYDKAILYASKMLDISRSIGDKEGEIASLQVLGYYYCLGIKDLNKAEEYANECLRLAEEYGNQGFLIAAYTVLSYIYVYQKRYDDCKNAVFNAWNLDSLNIQLSTLGNLAAAYMFSGELEEAYLFFAKYIYLLEDFTNKQFQENILNMDIKYETEKKELRIAALEKERKLYTIIGISGVTILLLAIGLLFVRHRIITQKRKLSEQQREISEQKVKQLEQEYQIIATQAALDGETAERSRLARDLHDGLGGMLSVVKLNLKDMKPYAIMEGADVEHFRKALDMLDQSIGELRRVAHHIMPESLMRCGLKVSLEDFCRAIPGTNFQYIGENTRLDNRLEVTLYRCAYELINNAVKHAQATAINVQLVVDQSVISLTVQDNGVGFDPQTVNSGIGLENIRARIAVYNGKMNVLSSPESGTEICIEIEL